MSVEALRPAEARVLALLATHYNLKRASTASDLELETLRTQLQSAKARLGVRFAIQAVLIWDRAKRQEEATA